MPDLHEVHGLLLVMPRHPAERPQQATKNKTRTTSLYSGTAAATSTSPQKRPQAWWPACSLGFRMPGSHRQDGGAAAPLMRFLLCSGFGACPLLQKSRWSFWSKFDGGLLQGEYEHLAQYNGWCYACTVYFCCVVADRAAAVAVAF